VTVAVGFFAFATPAFFAFATNLVAHRRADRHFAEDFFVVMAALTGHQLSA
jgi:hypothetical protein